MKRWRRSDIDTMTVLDAYAGFGAPRVDDYLVGKTGAPHKVVWTAMERELGRGNIDYGVNLRGGWLTDRGKSELARLRIEREFRKSDEG